MKIENRSCDPDDAPVSVGLSSVYKDLIQFTRVKNLTILASAIPETSLGALKIKMSYMTLNTPF